MKFSEMKYQRIDTQKVIEEIKEAIQQLKQAKDYPSCKAAFLRFDEISRHVQTQQELCSIRHSINTKDGIYATEQDFWDKTGPELTQYYQQAALETLNSPFRKQLEEEYGSVYFKNIEISLKTFKPEIIPDLQKENELTNKYNNVIASAQIEFEGKKYTVSQMAPFLNSIDDDQRRKAYYAVGSWFKSVQNDLDEIYDQLVAIRDKMGKQLGGKDYIELGYNRMGRNCYNKEMVEQFRNAVKQYVVPIADKIYQKQAKRLGYSYPLAYDDASIEFRSGNPKPAGDAKDILEAGREFYNWLSEETSAFFNMMMDNELLDVLSTEGKQAGGYCTAIADYKVPFIFANFNGTQHDVEVVTHEAGHAFAAYLNMDRVPSDLVWPSMEACEVHSMSMEFFGEKFADKFFGKDAKKFLYSHLAGALTFIPYGCLVDHFQHEMYQHPELTPAQRHQTWAKLQHEYMPWIKLDGKIPFYSEGCYWQRQQHIYNSPFYYIDYCLAQTVSLEFFKLIQEDKDNAWNHYMAYSKQGGTATFVDLLKNAGLNSPFDPNTLKNICLKAEEYLDKFDLSDVE